MSDVDEGPISRLIRGRPPFGPIEKLDSARLREEQAATLASPRRAPSLGARALFIIMDVVYGSERTLEKFRVLELVARVPYQAWENVAYVAVTQTAREPGFARRVFDRVRINRWEQDNEQWHAEHEYALLVQEHPEWDTMVFDSNFTAEFGQYDSRADLFRQIGYDERLHKLQSEATMTSPRFS